MMPAELLAQIEQGHFAPVYLLVGEEQLRLEETALAIEEATLSGGAADFNHERFRGKEVDPATLHAALMTLPMMAPRRLVRVREAHALLAAAWDAVVAYLAEPSATSVLLLTGEKIDRRSAAYKAIARSGCALQFDVPRERELVPWCRERARALGIRLEEGAARTLVEAIGRDPSGLHGALERLALYVGDGAEVDVAIVEEVVPETRVQSVFELCDAIGARDMRRAWALTSRLLGAREPPLKLLALVARHFRLLLRLRELRDAGTSRDAAGSELRISPYALRNLWPQTERHNLAGLQAAMEKLSAADIALKSSRLPSDLLFEHLVVELCRRTR